MGDADLDFSQCGAFTDLLRMGCFCSKHKAPALQYQEAQNAQTTHAAAGIQCARWKAPTQLCMVLTDCLGLADGEPLSRSGNESGGETLMASKNAALLLTELARDGDFSCLEAVAEPLVLQFCPACWHSGVPVKQRAVVLALFSGMLLLAGG